MKNPKIGDKIRVTARDFPKSAPAGSIREVCRIEQINTPPVPYYLIGSPVGSLGLYRDEFEFPILEEEYK
jgi:hypothetical protein